VNLYYLRTNLKRYQPLGHILAEYLGQQLNILEESEICRLVKKEDIVYYEIFINPYLENRCCLVGPEYYVANRWNSKIYQYNQLQNVVEVPSFEVFKNILRLISDLDRIKKKWKKFIIFEEFGYGGKNCLICDERTNVEQIFKLFPSNVSIRVSKFLNIIHNVSLHVIILDHKNIYLSPIVDQHIEGTLFKGGKYPSVLSDKLKSLVFESSLIVSKKLSDAGYLGMCHLDFILDDYKVYFCEINPRKAGTTMCVSYMMERLYDVSLPIIEYHVAQDNVLIVPNKCSNKLIKWDLKLIPYRERVTHSPGDERELFKSSPSVSTIRYNEFHKECSFEINIVVT